MSELALAAERVREHVGGRARAKVIALLAAVVGLETADVSAVGTAATQLEGAFHIRNAQLGLLVTVSLGVGALATIPFGMLADRVPRVRVLAIVIAIWSVAMVATGAAPSYGWLLISRLGLGAATAASFPLIASLIGDLFEPAERSRIYSFVLTGEFVGAGFGVLISGNLAAISWRLAFWALAVPSGALAWVLLRKLPEPARGGASRIAAGDDYIPAVEGPPSTSSEGGSDAENHGARRAAAEQGVAPAAERIAPASLRDMPLREAVGYILRVPTNRTLILASALGYFFFAGLRTFVVAFLRARFDLGQSAATMLLVGLGFGAVAGVLIGGRTADRLLEQGRLDARIAVPALAYLVGAAILLPGLLVTSLPIAMACYVAGAGFLSAANAPLDAARLDVMPSALWGRAESVRTALRQTAQAGAPLAFGALADALGGAGGEHVGGPGLPHAFLIMLSALVASGFVVTAARRHYPTDVATAAASEGD